VINLDPCRFIELGKDLIEDQNATESIYRTGINRIYFGTLHFLKIREQIYIRDPTEGFHYKIVKKIKAKSTVLGNQLETLKDFREDSDYYIDIKISKRNAEDALNIWERIKQNYIEPC
jgi:hypothetical protein